MGKKMKNLLLQVRIENKGLNLIKNKLLSLFSSCDEGKKKELCNILSEKSIKLFDESRNMLKNSLMIQSSESTLLSLQQVSIPNRVLNVIFDRGTQFSPDIQVNFGFFFDKDGNNLIKSFDEKHRLNPFTVDSDQFYYKLMSKNPQNTLKYKFAVIPLSTGVVLGKWIAEFLFKNTLNDINCSDILNLFESSLKYIFCSKVPTQQKQSMFLLLSNLVNELRKQGDIGYNYLESLPWKKIDKLKQELIALVETEKNRDVIHSTYVQSLMEFLVAVKLHQSQLNALKSKGKK